MSFSFLVFLIEQGVGQKDQEQWEGDEVKAGLKEIETLQMLMINQLQTFHLVGAKKGKNIILKCSFQYAEWYVEWYFCGVSTILSIAWHIHMTLIVEANVSKKNKS